MHWELPAEGKAVLQTYVVEASVDSGPFAQLVGTGQSLIATAWLHGHGQSERKRKRCYRVRAKDYWGAVSAPSSPAC